MKKVFFPATIPLVMICFLLLPMDAQANTPGDPRFQKQFVQYAAADPRFGPASDGQEHEDLEEQLQEVFEELRRLEKMFKNKMNKEVLPRIQEEIQRLKDWLEEQEKKKREPPPQWTRYGRETSGSPKNG